MTIRLPDDQHERIGTLAARRGISGNELIEQWSVRALAEADTEARFAAHAARGSTERGLALLGRLDDAYEAAPFAATGGGGGLR